VNDKGVNIVLADSEHHPAGFVIAITHPAAYWKSFVMRHPVLGLKIMGRRSLGGRASELSPAVISEEGLKLLEPHAPPYSWEQSDPTIARILFISVKPEFRKRGIGDALYRRLFELLRAQGVRAMNARIDCDNFASLQLHHRAGWKLYRDGDGCVFAMYGPGHN
jgi:ribosomal protein S18 acetylase RimI-like enzyme